MQPTLPGNPPRQTMEPSATTEDITSPAQTKSPRPARKDRKTCTFQITAPGAQSVAIAGTFNSWSPQPMLKDGDTWTFSLPLLPGRYEYRFVIDNQWTNDANAHETVPNDFGTTNSVVELS